MTAMTTDLERGFAAPRSSSGAVRIAAGRLFRLEVRRSAMFYLVPVVVAMFWFDTYRDSMALPAMWGPRTLFLREGTALTDFAPFVTGAAAWMGARDGRRRTADEIGSTALPRWAGRLATWAAIVFWALAAYALCVGVMFGVTLTQSPTGTFIVWPLLVDTAGILACTALGFAAGTAWSSRFTAPLAAIGAVVALLVVRKLAGKYAMLAPVKSPRYSLAAPQPQDGVFSHFRPDLSIVQIMLLAGVAFAALGAIGVSRRAGGVAVRTAAVVVTVGGVALVGTSFGLVRTSQVSAVGAVTIPAIHDAANDQPIVYSPVCGGAPVQICVHPAFKTYLPKIVATLEPVFAAVQEVPGAPTRVVQGVAPGLLDGPGASLLIAGDPPVLTIGLDIGYQGWQWYGLDGSAPPGSCCSSNQLWSSQQFLNSQLRPLVAMDLVEQLVGYQQPAQAAVASGLLQAMGVHIKPDLPPGDDPPPHLKALTSAAGAPVVDAAQRFAALPAADRHAWLVEHVAALRAGQVTLEQLP